VRPRRCEPSQDVTLDGHRLIEKCFFRTLDLSHQDNAIAVESPVVNHESRKTHPQMTFLSSTRSGCRNGNDEKNLDYANKKRSNYRWLSVKAKKRQSLTHDVQKIYANGPFALQFQMSNLCGARSRVQCTC
jgi:hypothetical protein